MKRGKGYDKSVYQSLSVVVQFGINMLVPICMMSAIGVYLDSKLGTSYIMVVLFFIGAIAGAQSVYRMARQIYSKPVDRREGRQIYSKPADRKAGRHNDVTERKAGESNEADRVSEKRK